MTIGCFANSVNRYDLGTKIGLLILIIGISDCLMIDTNTHTKPLLNLFLCDFFGFVFVSFTFNNVVISIMQIYKPDMTKREEN